mmetsp:Transcript_42790/g.69385  ORF Transcript_42790/g.69385 Transcript_42790/m.69385 type:complete len:157 (+) Transcript_42790:156-626(+)
MLHPLLHHDRQSINVTGSSSLHHFSLVFLFSTVLIFLSDFHLPLHLSLFFFPFISLSLLACVFFPSWIAVSLRSLFFSLNHFFLVAHFLSCLFSLHLLVCLSVRVWVVPDHPSTNPHGDGTRSQIPPPPQTTLRVDQIAPLNSLSFFPSLSFLAPL